MPRKLNLYLEIADAQIAMHEAHHRWKDAEANVPDYANQYTAEAHYAGQKEAYQDAAVRHGELLEELARQCT